MAKQDVAIKPQPAEKQPAEKHPTKWVRLLPRDPKRGRLFNVYVSRGIQFRAGTWLQVDADHAAYLEGVHNVAPKGMEYGIQAFEFSTKRPKGT